MGTITIQTEAGPLIFETSISDADNEGFAPASPPKSERLSAEARTMWGPVWSWAQDLVNVARASSQSPDEIELEFSVAATGGAQFYVVRGDVKGGVNVRVKWRAPAKN